MYGNLFTNKFFLKRKDQNLLIYNLNQYGNQTPIGMPVLTNRCFSPTNNILIPKQLTKKKTLVLDLDETLAHSAFAPFAKSDIILNVRFNNVIYTIYVLLRPGLYEFLEEMDKYYEIIIFTASLSEYASPLIDRIDPTHKCKFRLFREHCSYSSNGYIKDLKRLGRDLKDVIIIDNSPQAYSRNKLNGIPILSYFGNKEDNELNRIKPYLIFLSSCYDVREVIPQFVKGEVLRHDLAKKLIETANQQNKENINNENKTNENIKDLINSNNNTKFPSRNNTQFKYNDKECPPALTNANNIFEKIKLKETSDTQNQHPKLSIQIQYPTNKFHYKQKSCDAINANTINNNNLSPVKIIDPKVKKKYMLKISTDEEKNNITSNAFKRKSQVASEEKKNNFTENKHKKSISVSKSTSLKIDTNLNMGTNPNFHYYKKRDTYRITPKAQNYINSFEDNNKINNTTNKKRSSSRYAIDSNGNIKTAKNNNIVTISENKKMLFKNNINEEIPSFPNNNYNYNFIGKNKLYKSSERKNLTKKFFLLNNSKNT